MLAKDGTMRLGSAQGVLTNAWSIE